MGKLLTNGLTLINKELQMLDVLIEGSHIVKIGENLDPKEHDVIDLEGQLLAPGLVDLHIHLREPGGEHKETIKTGTQAAARGGFTTVAAMPNTNPVPDSVEHIEALLKRIKKDAVIRVLPYASITKGLKGETVNDLAALKKAGAFAFTDDGVGVQTAGMMLEAMKRAAKENRAIVAHCEDNSLVFGGSVHDGDFARKHGLKGIPNIAESVQIARDVLLAEAANCHYHVCHVSTKESVRVIRDAKRAGIHVTAEVSPHHLLLSDADIPNVDTHYKMNPPLRSIEDRKALIEGLLDGTLDFIATDHAPHAEEEKALPIEKAPFGIVGLETAFPLLYTHLVKKDVLSLEVLLDKMTAKPADAFHLPFGRIEVGGEADLVVIDLNEKKSVDPNEFLSKGRNTPFSGWELEGWPTLTIYNGNIVWEKGRVEA